MDHLWYGGVFCAEINRWKVMLWLMMHDLQIVLAWTEVFLNLFQQVGNHTW